MTPDDLHTMNITVRCSASKRWPHVVATAHFGTKLPINYEDPNWIGYASAVVEALREYGREYSGGQYFKTLCVNYSHVEKPFQRHGVGTKLYATLAVHACTVLHVPLASDTDYNLSEYSRPFWQKQERRGRADRRLVQIQSTGDYDTDYDYRYILKCPVPDSLSGWSPKVIPGGRVKTAFVLPTDPLLVARWMMGFHGALKRVTPDRNRDIHEFSREFRDGYAAGRRLRGPDDDHRDEAAINAIFDEADRLLGWGW